jgi:toxin-antitoxin system PIN domain toxin
MRLWDVNIWIYAFRSDSPLHEKARNSIQSALDGRESFLFCPGIASSFLRLVTNPRIFKEPSPIAEAWLFVDALESHPAAIFADMDPMAFGIFKHLCLASGVAGNAIPDAYVAALAIRRDALFVTADRGFARFKGIELELVG